MKFCIKIRFGVIKKSRGTPPAPLGVDFQGFFERKNEKCSEKVSNFQVIRKCFKFSTPPPDMCAGVDGGWAEGQACADREARNPIGASGNFLTDLSYFLTDFPDFLTDFPDFLTDFSYFLTVSDDFLSDSHNFLTDFPNFLSQRWLPFFLTEFPNFLTEFPHFLTDFHNFLTDFHNFLIDFLIS